jgi:hypothetical protein
MALFGGRRGQWRTNGSGLVLAGSLLMLTGSVSGCASGGTGPGSSGEPISWQEGRFELQGAIEYRRDTEWAASTEKVEYYAELVIQSGGSLQLFTSAGICLDRLPNEVSRDRANRQRTFRCGEATYVLRPLGRSVRGTLRIPVMETVQARGPCIQYQQTSTGQRVCVQYSTVTRTRRTTKNTQLRVIKIGETPRRRTPQGLG